MTTQKQTPYEFLARFTDGGAFAGAHVVYRFALVDDAGAEVGKPWFGDPQPIAPTDAALLGAVSAQINAAALAEIGAAKTAADAAVAKLAALQAERDSLAAQVAELAPTVNGVPQEVSKQQAERAMLRAVTVNPTGGNLLDVINASVAAYIASIPDAFARRDAQLKWAGLSAYRRTDPLLLSMMPVVQHAMNLADEATTSAFIDQLFTTAETL